MTRDLERAGELLRANVTDQTTTARHAELRARFVQDTLAPKRSFPVRLASVLAMGVLAVTLLVWPRHTVAPKPADLVFYVGAGDQRGHIGTYYSAPAASELAVRFSDGSRITLQPTSGIRVSRADTDEAALSLEKGRARVAVEHHQGRAWRVAAGPYTVHVTGTRFAVGWDSTNGKLEVEMQSGKVRITGPGMESGVEVSGTQRFVSQSQAWVEERAERVEAPVASPSVPGTPTTPSLPATAAGNRASEARPPSTSTTVSWKDLVARGDYAALISAAESRGVDETLRTADAAQLSALADGARFTGRRSLARRALLSLRNRFSGSEPATSAAFILGRLEDDAGNETEALDWYDTYLSEGGPLASEALGRKMIALSKLGRTEQAQRAAQQYLERFADGAYAAHARDIAR